LNILARKAEERGILKKLKELLSEVEEFLNNKV